MKISIIVAIYNVEFYIEECVKSILNQNYKNFELILVNDGSTDNSEKICKQFTNDKRVQYYYKKNGGLSDARNYGIKKSKGDYLMFVDGDDFLKDEYCLNKINTALKKHRCDILQYKMAYFYQKKNKIQELKNLQCDFSSKKLYKRLNDLNKNGSMSISACDKIVKASIIKENNIYFEKGIYSEDIDWSLKLYLHSSKCRLDVINETIYIYRQQRVGSITAKKSNKRCKDLWYIIKKWYYYNYSNNDTKELYYNYLAYQTLVLLTICPKRAFNKNEYYSIKKIYKELAKYNDNYKVNLFKKMSKFLGVTITLNLTKFYLVLKNKGVIKI